MRREHRNTATESVQGMLSRISARKPPGVPLAPDEAQDPATNMTGSPAISGPELGMPAAPMPATIKYFRPTGGTDG